MILEANKENILKAAEALKAGDLVAFATETVYGLGADARNDLAIQKIYSTKGRPSNNPLIIHSHEIEGIFNFVDLSNAQIKNWIEKLRPFIPGPLSLVLPNPKGVSKFATAGHNSVAVRVPNHPVALALLKECNFPVAAPSANRSSYISPTTALHVEQEFKDRDLLILDGGPCQVGIESTVLSLLDNKPRILRPGFITSEQISDALGESLLEATTNKESPLLSPGMLEKHYSPLTPLRLVDSKEFGMINASADAGYISISNTRPKGETKNLIRLTQHNQLTEVAMNLYAAMRELDSRNLREIIVETCEAKGLGVAIMDRLIRASTK